MERFSRKTLLVAFIAVLGFSACGNDQNDAKDPVDSGPITAGNGLLSAVPALTLKLDGSYAPLAYATDSPLELVECSTDSNRVLVGCSTDNAIVHVSVVALSGADATRIHVQVKNATETFDRVTIPVLVKSSCQEIKDAGLAQENSIYIVHQPGDPAGVNTQVNCQF